LIHFILLLTMMSPENKRFGPLFNYGILISINIDVVCIQYMSVVLSFKWG
jgi:hypothetical protein